MRAQCESAEARVKGRECRGESTVRECRESARVQSRECRVESTENTRAQSREEGAQCTMRPQSESAETRVQRARECRVESTESARMQRRECNVRVQSRECRECESTESNGGTTVHDESTVRGTESECRVESAENARVQSRECRVESAESHCALHTALSCARHWATRVTVRQSKELAVQRGDTEHAEFWVRAGGRYG
jgi:hypothetical protein